ncbi:hypothetical protein EDB83DRAFT_2319707 [Lactarius deliciosus]|nr:hypothetical protein EDB83DRAFT_2319707 [Lactarius deliciosus]
MPAREFLSSFLPSDSEEVPSAFKEGMFLDLVNSKLETAIPSAEADPARAEFFVKCKGSHSNNPFAKTLQAAMDGENIFMKHHNAGNTTGQIVNYIAAQMGCQYRTHTFLVLVVKDYARLTRWDCGGVIVTDRIEYNKSPEFLEFFERYNVATPEVWGNDLSVTEPTNDEANAAKEICGNDSKLLVALIDNLDLHAEPHRRLTHTSIAYDVQRKKAVYMKDLWQIVMDNAMSEGLVHQMLNKNKVKNIPPCVDFGNVDVIGKRLQDFGSSCELVRAVRAAIIDDPTFDGGLLIDWDMCKVKDRQGGSSRKARTGTWQFMAADLVMDPCTTHSFIHDLKSTFYVLLWLALQYMKNSWKAGIRSNFINTTMNPQIFGDTGGRGKVNFMGNCKALQDFSITSNDPLTSLIRKLKDVLSIWYVKDSSPQLEAFMPLKDYELLDYNHDVIIKLFDEALENQKWPPTDSAVKQETLRSNADNAKLCSKSSKRVGGFLPYFTFPAHKPNSGLIFGTYLRMWGSQSMLSGDLLSMDRGWCRVRLSFPGKSSLPRYRIVLPDHELVLVLSLISPTATPLHPHPLHLHIAAAAPLTSDVTLCWYRTQERHHDTLQMPTVITVWLGAAAAVYVSAAAHFLCLVSTTTTTKAIRAIRIYVGPPTTEHSTA